MTCYKVDNYKKKPAWTKNKLNKGLIEHKIEKKKKLKSLYRLIFQKVYILNIK